MAPDTWRPQPFAEEPSIDGPGGPGVAFHTMNRPAKRQLLEHPEMLGCPVQFAARLGVPETQLAEWMRGELTIPDGKFLVIAAILEHAERIRNPA
jgi:hypothetical protein